MGGGFYRARGEKKGTINAHYRDWRGENVFQPSEIKSGFRSLNKQQLDRSISKEKTTASRTARHVVLLFLIAENWLIARATNPK